MSFVKREEQLRAHRTGRKTHSITWEKKRRRDENELNLFHSLLHLIVHCVMRFVLRFLSPFYQSRDEKILEIFCIQQDKGRESCITCASRAVYGWRRCPKSKALRQDEKATAERENEIVQQQRQATSSQDIRQQIRHNKKKLGKNEGRKKERFKVKTSHLTWLCMRPWLNLWLNSAYGRRDEIGEQQWRKVHHDYCRNAVKLQNFFTFSSLYLCVFARCRFSCCLYSTHCIYFDKLSIWWHISLY